MFKEKIVRIILWGLLLLASFYFKWCNDKNSNIQPKKRSLEIYEERQLKERQNKKQEEKEKKEIKLPEEMLSKIEPIDFDKFQPRKLKPFPKIFPQPKSGFSPYDTYFNKGVYDDYTQNSFEIKNSNATDAIVLLVNAYSGKKIRNEYIRKGETFKMTNVPNGVYYLEWASGNYWDPSMKVGKLTGGFQEDVSFTKTKDKDDWMIVNGSEIWTVTLYSVRNGDVESETLTAEDFGN